MKKPTPPTLCLIEDDEIMGESLCDRFALEGLRVDWQRTGADGLRAITGRHYDLIISDIHLPDLNGEEMFEHLLASGQPLPPFIFITGYASIDRAVRLLKLGAADYISKPFDLDQLIEKVCQLCPPVEATPAAEQGELSLGTSPAMREIEAGIPRLARMAKIILITGESGSGKEHVAQLVHRHASEGKDSPFIAVNCGAITETLLESELFGYEKGAFTGAVRTRKGVFEQAHGGTLFLDEIGEMSLGMQVKLLRALQERHIVRVGGETRIPVDVRLICATHRDLKKMVEEGSFREDLYYRIHVIRLRVPPLRERKEDIPWFVQIFLRECCNQHGDTARALSPAAERALLAHSWPGNLRELKHSVERACILSNGAVLEAEAFFDDHIIPATHAPSADDTPSGSLAEYLRECEQRFIQRTIERNSGHLGHTAEALGISRKNLWEKMKKLGIQTGHGDGK